MQEQAVETAFALIIFLGHRENTTSWTLKRERLFLLPSQLLSDIGNSKSVGTPRDDNRPWEQDKKRCKPDHATRKQIFGKLSIQCSQASTRWSQETKLKHIWSVNLLPKQNDETETIFCFGGIQKKQQHFWSKKKSSTGQDLNQNAKFRHTYKLRPKCASKSALMMPLHRTTNGSFGNFLKLSCAKVQRTSYNTDSLYSSGRLRTLLVSELLLLLLRWNKQKCGCNNRDPQTTKSKEKGGKNTHTQGQKTKTMSKRPNQKKQKYAQNLKENARNTRNSENNAQEHEEEVEEETGQDQQQQSSPRKEKEGKQKKERKKRANHEKENPKQNQKYAAYLLTWG